jgi:hypothetical protein
MSIENSSNLGSATYDLLGQISDHTVVATWEGVEYDGTSGGLVSSKRLDPDGGGFLADYDLQWVTSLYKRTAPGVNELVARFPSENASVPEEGDQLTISGVAYRIERVTKDDFGAGLAFDLVNLAKMR